MYDDRRNNHKPTLQNHDDNTRGKMISTSDIPVRIKPQHLVATGVFNSKNESTQIMNLDNKFGGPESFQVHTHDGTTWHQVPTHKTRQRGDQVPLSPRSNESMTAKRDNWFKDL
jgi:hypothetical protein